MAGAAPVLLLDEVLAHLDPARRLALHRELAELGAQTWMTGADPALFREIESLAGLVEVKSGTLTASSNRG
jgi:DNA replication and repair protein RecF